MSDQTLERTLARDRWICGGCVAFVVALAWLWLWRQSAAMSGNSAASAGMPDMDMGGAMMVSSADSAAYLASAFAMWLLMMIAMMLPSATPMILLYSRLSRGARAQGAALAPTAIFALVYLLAWAAFSLAAACAQLLLIRSGVISELTLAFGDRRIAGALLIAAGLYQTTPLKQACLESCRSPMSFLMRLWRPNWSGAARLGLAHGLYCLGCCALLMALLFVFGVMNLAWVAALSLFVVLEKLLPLGSQLGIFAGLAAIGAGVVMMVA